MITYCVVVVGRELTKKVSRIANIRLLACTVPVRIGPIIDHGVVNLFVVRMARVRHVELKQLEL